MQETESKFLRPLRNISRTIEVVGNPREKELTAFVRHAIRLWEKGEWPGQPLKDGKRDVRLTTLEQMAAPFISAGYTTRVREGDSGVSGRSAKGFAKAFGFVSERALRDAAYEWYEKEGESLETKAVAPEDPDLALVLAGARTIYGDDPEIEQTIREMLEEYGKIPALDRDDWLMRLQMTHRKRVARRGLQVGAREAEAKQRRKRRRIQGELTEKTSESPNDAEAPASAKPASKRKRHR